MNWQLSWKADPRAKRIADRHYNRQSPDSPQFVPPGRSLVLVTRCADAFWITSYPEYVTHAWPGAWVCSAFRNDMTRWKVLSSTLIREAVAITRSTWPTPQLGMITFIDPNHVRPKEHVGRCFLKAGFRRAICSEHMIVRDGCAACHGRTKRGLVALQMLPADMPDPIPLEVAQMSLQLGFNCVIDAAIAVREEAEFHADVKRRMRVFDEAIERGKGITIDAGRVD